MRRRDFLAFIGAAAAAWPIRASAQTSGLPVVGFLNGGSPATFGHLAAAFREGLKEGGFVEGQNVTVEYRWAEGREDRMPGLAADLVQRRVRVLTIGGPQSIEFKLSLPHLGVPVVSNFAANPADYTSIHSLARTGVNQTGVNVFSLELEAKRFELLGELVPNAKRFGVFIEPAYATHDLQLREIEAAARSTGRSSHFVNISTDADLEKGYAALREMQAEALVITATPFFNIKRMQLAALSARYGIPTIHEVREFVEAGGLVSYGPSIPGVYRQLGIYAGRILKGEKASDLPIVQPTTFSLALNLKAAEALKVEIPSSILARADTIIE